jgi:hypothetical protein
MTFSCSTLTDPAWNRQYVLVFLSDISLWFEIEPNLNAISAQRYHDSYLVFVDLLRLQYSSAHLLLPDNYGTHMVEHKRQNVHPKLPLKDFVKSSPESALRWNMNSPKVFYHVMASYGVSDRELGP